MNKEASSRAINKEGEGDAERIQLCCCPLALPVSSVTPGHRPCLVLAVAFPIPAFSHAAHIWVVQRSWSIPGLLVVMNAKTIMFGHLSSLGQRRSWCPGTGVLGVDAESRCDALGASSSRAEEDRGPGGVVRCCFWDPRRCDGTQRRHPCVTLHPSAHLI